MILQGFYGLKRFLRDGYRTVLEDKNRRYYEKRELQVILLIELHFFKYEWTDKCNCFSKHCEGELYKIGHQRIDNLEEPIRFADLQYIPDEHFFLFPFKATFTIV